MGNKIVLADRMFSQFIRARDGWRCKKCGRLYEIGDPLLNNSHFFTKGAHASVRFDPENTDALCQLTCHAYFETHRDNYTAWKKHQLGEERFDALVLRAHTIVKMSDSEAVEYVKSLQKGL